MKIRTKEARQQVLNAYDAINSVRIFTGHGKGSSSACAICDSFMGDPHKPDCPIGIADAAIQPLVPPFFDREKWLDAE
jgi:hypothetical protein